VVKKSLITKYTGPLLPEGTLLSYNNCSSYNNELILKELNIARLTQQGKRKHRSDIGTKRYWIEYYKKMLREINIEKENSWSDGNYIELKELSSTEISKIYTRQIG